jgi:hypothetical protein
MNELAYLASLVVPSLALVGFRMRLRIDRRSISRNGCSTRGWDDLRSFDELGRLSGRSSTCRRLSSLPSQHLSGRRLIDLVFTGCSRLLAFDHDPSLYVSFLAIEALSSTHG